MDDTDTWTGFTMCLTKVNSDPKSSHLVEERTRVAGLPMIFQKPFDRTKFERIARMYLALDDREDLPEKVLTEMKLTRKWVLAIVGDKWPLQHRHVLGRAIRIRSPYVDVLSLTQVLALKALRKKADNEELSHGRREGYTYLILCTVSGVAAGLQNTG